MNAAINSSQRAAREVRLELSRGLAGLNAVAATSTMVSVTAVVLGIIASFQGTTGDKVSIWAAVMNRLAFSLVPALLGLVISITVDCGRRHLTGEIERFDLEMASVATYLASTLRRISK